MALTKVSRGLLSTSIVDNGNATAITIDASENVGIGTSSPTYKFNVLASSGSQNIFQAGQSGVSNGLSITSNGSALTYSFLTGNVGIGTSSPSGPLNIHSASGDTNLYVTTGNTAASTNIFFGDSGNSTIGRIVYDHNGDYMKFRTNGSDAMRIDASGNVGIFNSSPAAKLDIVEATSTTAVKIKSGTSTNQNTHITMFNDNDGGTLALGVFGSGATTFGTITATDGFITSNQELCLNSQNSSGAIKFGVGSTPTEAMRIDSAGQIFFQKSSENIGVVGMQFLTNGLTQLTASGTPLYLNRLSSDGEIVSFRKDGSTVGSIRTVSGDVTIDGGSEHTGLRFEATDITPRHNGSASDNVNSLGTSAARFKDLFLSGGAYLGGTGSANKLDDYEEGSFTPVLNSFTGSYTHQIGQYRKVGGLVTAAIHIHISSTGGNGDLIVTGLPFTQVSNSRYGSATTIHCSVWSTTTKPDNVLVNPGSTNAAFYKVAGQTGIVSPQLSDMGTGNLLCVFVYMTDQ
jgi:hypothetical protein